MTDIAAQHEFHDRDYVREWAQRFTPTPERRQLFDLILSRLGEPTTPQHIVELGLGPGFMAQHILKQKATITYEGLDFSTEMFDIAKDTLGPLSSRVTFTLANLLEPQWPTQLAKTPDAIISTWSLHDLGCEDAIADVYQKVFATLPTGGVFLNGDFIKPAGIDWTYEPGRIEIARHLELLSQAGFTDPTCLAHLEPSLDAPTTSNNYACFFAQK